MTPRRVLAMAYCLFVFSAPAYAQGWPDVVAAATRGVVRIDLGDGQQSAHCSGAVIDVDKGLVLTAAHCVPSVFGTIDGFSFSIDGRDAKVEAINRVLDLAILKTKVPRASIALLLSTSTPAAGAAVAVLGYPLDAQSVTVQVGVMANPAGMEPHTSDVNIAVLPGNSGGPLVDNAGHLVGVVSGYRYSGIATMAIVTDLQTLRHFIEDAQ